MVGMILKIILPLVEWLFGKIKEKEALRKEYYKLIKDFEKNIDSSYLEEEKDAWKKLNEE